MAKDKFISGAKINREYSWIQFNKRVLDQAEDLNHPILERCKFLSIFVNNFDEFFMVRVGSLINDLSVNPDSKDYLTGMTAKSQLSMIFESAQKLNTKRCKIYTKLHRELKEHSVKIMEEKTVSDRQKMEAKEIFFLQIMPFLSPMVIDSKHPLFHFENLASYVVLELERDGQKLMGIVPVVSKINRIYRLKGKNILLITLEEIIKLFAGTLFEGYTVLTSTLVRVTRNADINTREESMFDENGDFSKFIKGQVELRSRLMAVRLEMDCENERIQNFLMKKLGLNKEQCFIIKDLLDYKFFFFMDKFLPQELAEQMKYPPLNQKSPLWNCESKDLIEEVLKRDILTFYPYETMNFFIEFLNQCAHSPQVNIIKITIYRLASNSKIVDALITACKNGKKVTVVIELCARFDEESNLHFANILKEAGCTIIYGMGDFKVHSKIASVVLNTPKGVKFITHLGTGNYNENTAKIYTDLNIITSDEEIGRDAVEFFNNLSIGNTQHEYRKLLVAPNTLKSNLSKLIEEEMELAKQGKETLIFAKVNSLSDGDIISKLIDASKAGVKIKLVVRGICCLLPSIEGKTENIQIKSIVGRFLEHSRIYSFGTKDRRKVFISSADLMSRNLSRRVEIAAPVLDLENAQRIYGILENCFKDNVLSYTLENNGKYIKSQKSKNEEPFDSQNHYIWKE